MKNHGKNLAALWGALLAGAFLLPGSCSNLLNAPDEPARVSAGKGRLAIVVDDSARTAFPAESFDSYKLRFEYTGGSEGYTHEDEEWSEDLAVDLEPGDWTISVDAYAGAAVSGIGSADVTVIEGDNPPVTLRISINTDAGIKGTLKLTITYPPDDPGVHKYVPMEIPIYPGAYFSSPADIDNISTDFNTANETALDAFSQQILGGAAGEVDLDPGDYAVMMIVADIIQGTANAKMEMVHIYGGMETELTLEFRAEEFTTAVPVSGTANYSFASVDPAPAVNGRTIGVYTDEACTEALPIPPVEIAADGAFALKLSVGPGPVYFRQELDMGGGLIVNGEVKTIYLSSGTSEVLEINDVFYRLTLPPGINGNTVGTTNYVFKEALVTLTGMNTYAAQTGAFSIKSDIAGFSYSGNWPDYSFSMPGGDVTVTGVISKSPNRYVTQNGAGDKDGSSWDHASNDIQKMLDELAYLKVNNLAAAPYVVKVGAGTYKPQYAPGPNGESLADADLSANSRTSRDKTFMLRQGVEILGGYTADGEYIDETTRKSRFNTYGIANPGYQAILSGDLDGDTILSNDDAYHVVLGLSIPGDSGTVLDGLTIKGGKTEESNDLSLNISIDNKPIYKIGGGGLYNESSSPFLTRVTITGNSDCGIANLNSSPVLANVTISDNTAGGGGGMYNDNSSPTLTDVIIRDNTASDGGGGGISNSNSSSPVLTNVTISGNSAGDGGGGIFNNNSSPVLTNVTMLDNTASGSSGGGLYNSNSSSPTLTNVTISGNTASANGGGIFNYDSSPVLTNVIISGNFTDAGGGGIFNAGSSPVLTNVTISGNSASNSSSGGGMDNSSSSPQIRNSIIWGNVAGVLSAPSGIHNASSTPTISYSIVEGATGSGGSWAHTGSNNGGNNAGDPGSGELYSPFVANGWIDPSAGSWQPTSSGDYRLKSGSPAIDAGNYNDYPGPSWSKWETLIVPSIITEDVYNAYIKDNLGGDLDGLLRLKGGEIDIGAYEF
jgi:hypothetical protein